MHACIHLLTHNPRLACMHAATPCHAQCSTHPRRSSARPCLHAWRLYCTCTAPPCPVLQVVVVDLPFSEFVKCVRTRQVSMVSIDGLSINFALRPDSPMLAEQVRRERRAPMHADMRASVQAHAWHDPFWGCGGGALLCPMHACMRCITPSSAAWGCA